MSTSQTLILRLAGAQAPSAAQARMEFAQRGGSIGRSDESDWVLAAPGISRTHAVVRYLNGMFFLEDRSTNGMLHNGVPMTRGEPAALGDGDRLQMDTFEIEVSLGAAASAAPAAEQTGEEADRTTVALPDPEPAAPPLSSPSAVPPEVPAASPARLPDDLLADIGLGAGASLDPLDLLGPAPPQAGEPAADAGGWNQSPAMADHFQPPRPAGAAPQLPEEWDLTGFESDPPDAAPAPAPAPPPPAPAADATPSSVAAAPAAGSTRQAQALPPEMEQIFGIVVDGVMEVLRARAEIKNTFRLPVTIVQRSENNPLKFAATPAEAIEKILRADNAAFLSGAHAFEDAFDDIRCHQMAMLAGMRAAFESLLFHFNPDRLEQELDSSGKRSPFSGKGRYWERYRENFANAVKDPDESFRRMFGDEFARAYEAQLARLKSARKLQRR